MKKYYTVLALILLAAGAQFCKSGNKSQESFSKTSSDTTLDTTMRAGTSANVVKLDTSEKSFILNIGMDGKMGEEAAGFMLLKSKNQEVRAFAKAMIKTQMKIRQDLETVARPMGITLPLDLLPDREVALQKLKEAMRQDADKKYIIMTINMQKKAIDLFDKASTFKSGALRTFAVKTSPVLKQHLAMATEIGKKLNVSNRGNGDNLSNVEADTTSDR
jgi:putative membrane protein